MDLAIERCLSGERKWALDSRCDYLEVCLMGVIKSLAHSAKKSAARQKVELSVDHRRPPRAVATATVDPVVDDIDDGENEVYAAVAGCAEGDADLEHTIASATPVLPDVASHTVCPGLSTPRRSVSYMIPPTLMGLVSLPRPGSLCALHSRLERVKMISAQSAMISGVRLPRMVAASVALRIACVVAVSQGIEIAPAVTLAK